MKSGSGRVVLTKRVATFVKLGHFTDARLTRRPLVKAFTMPRHMPGAGLSITLGRCCVGQVVPRLSIIWSFCHTRAHIYCLKAFFFQSKQCSHVLRHTKNKDAVATSRLSEMTKRLEEWDFSILSNLTKVSNHQSLYKKQDSTS